MGISDACLGIAITIDEVREEALQPLHKRVYDYSASLARYKRGSPQELTSKTSLLTNIGIAKDAVKQSIVDTGYATDGEVKNINSKLEQLSEAVDKNQTIVAFTLIEELDHDLFNLMLNKAVACECHQR